MIKNIVFDIGNVLISFKPLEYLDSFKYEESLKNVVYNAVFRSKYWVELDRGTITEEEAIKQFCKEAPEVEAEIREVMKGWKDILVPIPETIGILKKLKEKGYRLFVLSNYHQKAFERTETENDFFQLLDGKIISYNINYVKPEKEIYEHLLNSYDLKADETLFIDDMEENIKGASCLGINTIFFQDSESLEKSLEQLGIL